MFNMEKRISQEGSTEVVKNVGNAIKKTIIALLIAEVGILAIFLISNQYLDISMVAINNSAMLVLYIFCKCSWTMTFPIFANIVFVYSAKWRAWKKLDGIICFAIGFVPMLAAYFTLVRPIMVIFVGEELADIFTQLIAILTPFAVCVTIGLAVIELNPAIFGDNDELSIGI